MWNGTGSDDPDNLGHFFGGSSGSHPQTKVSGCELESHACLLEKGVVSVKACTSKKVGIENLSLKKLATI